jgi:hypothetical protein
MIIFMLMRTYDREEAVTGALVPELSPLPQ